MANKKLLICAALATGLLLTACVKKEEPKNEEPSEQTSETQTTQAASQPQQSPYRRHRHMRLESHKPIEV